MKVFEVWSKLLKVNTSYVKLRRLLRLKVFSVLFMTVIWYEMMWTLKGLMEKTRMRLLNDLGGLIQVAFWLLMIVWNKPEKLSAFKREPRATMLCKCYASAKQVLCKCYASAMLVICKYNASARWIFYDSNLIWNDVNIERAYGED